MTDTDLLQYYLELHSPDGAAEHNLSPECLYTEFCMGDAIRTRLKPWPGMRILNVGIGVGDWDDFLGYWAHNYGTLVSVDIDEGICNLFRFRQEREKHPNPSRVICQDILATRLRKSSFDIVTMVGSTADETGNASAALDACFRLVKQQGYLFLMLFNRRGAAEIFQKCKPLMPCKTIYDAEFSHYEEVRFRIFIGQKIRCVKKPKPKPGRR